MARKNTDKKKKQKKQKQTQKQTGKTQKQTQSQTVIVNVNKGTRGKKTTTPAVKQPSIFQPVIRYSTITQPETFKVSQPQTIGIPQQETELYKTSKKRYETPLTQKEDFFEFNRDVLKAKKEQSIEFTEPVVLREIQKSVESPEPVQYFSESEPFLEEPPPKVKKTRIPRGVVMQDLDQRYLALFGTEYSGPPMKLTEFRKMIEIEEKSRK